jgi:TonB family protein
MESRPADSYALARCSERVLAGTGNMKNNIIGPLVRSASMALLLSGVFVDPQAAEPAAGSQSAAEKVDVTVFQGVQILKAPGSNTYPTHEERDGKEGWAVLNMMIDPHGKPYEVTVVDSIGNPAFEKAAIAAVDQMSFAPAKRGTTPIDSSFMFKMYFSRAEPARGARSRFVSTYRKFTHAIEAGDKAQADQYLSKLDAQNLYEDAFRNFGKYFYDRKWGTEADQLRDLKRAIGGEKNDQYLPRQAFVTALGGMFILQVNANDYGGALDTWRTLDGIAPKEMRDKLRPSVDQINALRNSDKPVAMSVRIDRGTTWHGTLFKNRFRILVTSGAVAEIKLRCAQQYLLFNYDASLEYSVTSRSGPCGIEVIGDAGTLFDLIQS